MKAGARVGKLTRPECHAIVAERDGVFVGVLNSNEHPREAEDHTGHDESRRNGAAREKHDPKRPHWHIGPIGVRPDLQGQSIGSTLLGSFLDEVDAAASAAYLETDVDRNVTLYERFGFKVIGRTDMGAALQE